MTPTLHVLTSIEGRELEAYAYHDDPLEQSPCGESPEAQEALGALLTWSNEQARIAAGEPAPVVQGVLDEATREELRALGYLQGH
ncbi:hypothetical protein KAT82_06305 [bacterium]|nr:hypothetical protein [bacterium]